jgi:DNA repair protein RecO (recombination protein O)
MTFLTEAFVLRRGLRGEFDRQYTLLTSDLGKVSVIAKSASKTISKLASHLDFFCLSEVMIAPGAGMHRLAGAKIKFAPKNIQQNLSKLALANVFFEAVDLLLLERAQEKKVFLISNNFINQLDNSATVRESLIIFNQHLFSLLSILGYEPQLDYKKQSELGLAMIKTVQEISDKKFCSLPALTKIFSQA